MSNSLIVLKVNNYRHSLIILEYKSVSTAIIHTTGKQRRVSRWVHEEVVERAAARLAAKPDAMQIRRATVEHPYGTLKAWMGSTHFLTKTLDHVSTEMSLHEKVRRSHPGF